MQSKKAISSQTHEIKHFKTMVRTLRSELEQKAAVHEEKLQKEANLKSMEFNQLQETIRKTSY